MDPTMTLWEDHIPSALYWGEKTLTWSGFELRVLKMKTALCVFIYACSL